MEQDKASSQRLVSFYAYVVYLSSLPAVKIFSLQAVWTKIMPNKMLGLILIQTDTLIIILIF